MAINKVKNNAGSGEILLDLTTDGLTSDTSKVDSGVKYHGRDGVQYTGTGKTDVLNITENGTYDVSQYGSIVVDVQPQSGFTVTLTASGNWYHQSLNGILIRENDEQGSIIFTQYPGNKSAYPIELNFENETNIYIGVESQAGTGHVDDIITNDFDVVREVYYDAYNQNHSGKILKINKNGVINLDIEDFGD